MRLKVPLQPASHSLDETLVGYLGFTAHPDEAWLLITALPGRSAYQVLEQCPEERRAIIRALAAYLRQLHAIPAQSCPFNSDHRLRLSEARWRLAKGLVDEGDFDAVRRGWTAQQVWDAMAGLLPFAEDAVVTHATVLSTISSSTTVWWSDASTSEERGSLIVTRISRSSETA